jgi:hypothetical protein
MRRLGQDRGETRRIIRAVFPDRLRLIPLLALALAVLTASAGTAIAAKPPAGCGGKPGTPDRAALLQYCPKQARSGSGAPGAAGQAAPPPSTGQPANGGGKPNAAGRGDKPDLPLTNYPSSGGINVLLLILILIALAGAVAYGARRWRRSRPQPSR